MNTRCGARRLASALSLAHRQQLRRGFGQRAALHQGLRLRQAIGHQEIMVNREAPVHAIWRRDQEFDRDHAGALMDELEEGVLAIGAGLAPDNGSGLGLGGGLPSRSTPFCR